MIFRKRGELYTHHDNVILGRFHSPRKKPGAHLPSPPLQPSSQATGNLPSVVVALPVLDISFKWSHTLCGLCVWRLLLSILFSGFVHVAAGVRAPFLSVAESQSTGWLDHGLFIPSSIRRHSVVFTLRLL